MQITLKYVQKRGDAEWRYRRKVPQELRQVVGKRELLIPLGSTESEAVRRYTKVHALAEKKLADAAKRVAAGTRVAAEQSTPSPLEQYMSGQRQLRALGLGSGWHGEDSDGGPHDLDHEWEARGVVADGLLSRYPEGAQENPRGLSDADAALLRSLHAGVAQSRPSPTVEDAKRLYGNEKLDGDEKKHLELDRVFRHLDTVLGKNRPLTSLKREDAKEVKEHLLNGRKPSSVDRYLNVVRAAFNHAIREYDLDWRNPFMGLEVVRKDKAEPDRDKRRPFTEEEAALTTRRILDHAKTDLEHIWRILAGTGCRLAEVAGLRRADVHLHHAIPHIVVEWHDERRIKTMVSRRRVPLIGDALVAAQEALKAAGSGTMVFPRYGRKGGAGSASAALGKHVRKVIADRKIVTHSLRHLMKDRLRLAEVSKADQDIVLGHSSGSVGEDYGGDEVRLKVAERALRAAAGCIVDAHETSAAEE